MSNADLKRLLLKETFEALECPKCGSKDIICCRRARIHTQKDGTSTFDMWASGGEEFICSSKDCTGMIDTSAELIAAFETAATGMTVELGAKATD